MGLAREHPIAVAAARHEIIGRELVIAGYVERLAVDVPDRIKSVVAVGPVSAAGIKMSEADRQFFVDVITDDDKCRELASRITGHKLSPQWQEVKLRLARDTRTREAARGYLPQETAALDARQTKALSARCGIHNLLLMGIANLP